MDIVECEGFEFHVTRNREGFFYVFVNDGASRRHVGHVIRVVPPVRPLLASQVEDKIETPHWIGYSVEPEGHNKYFHDTYKEAVSYIVGAFIEAEKKRLLKDAIERLGG